MTFMTRPSTSKWQIGVVNTRSFRCCAKNALNFCGKSIRQFSNWFLLLSVVDHFGKKMLIAVLIDIQIKGLAHFNQLLFRGHLGFTL